MDYTALRDLVLKVAQDLAQKGLVGRSRGRSSRKWQGKSQAVPGTSEFSGES
jgi:hypothetical protein